MTSMWTRSGGNWLKKIGYNWIGDSCGCLKGGGGGESKLTYVDVHTQKINRILSNIASSKK